LGDPATFAPAARRPDRGPAAPVRASWLAASPPRSRSTAAAPSGSAIAAHGWQAPGPYAATSRPRDLTERSGRRSSRCAGSAWIVSRTWSARLNTTSGHRLVRVALGVVIGVPNWINHLLAAAACRPPNHGKTGVTGTNGKRWTARAASVRQDRVDPRRRHRHRHDRGGLFTRPTRSRHGPNRCNFVPVRYGLPMPLSPRNTPRIRRPASDVPRPDCRPASSRLAASSENTGCGHQSAPRDAGACGPASHRATAMLSMSRPLARCPSGLPRAAPGPSVGRSRPRSPRPGSNADRAPAAADVQRPRDCRSKPNSSTSILSGRRRRRNPAQPATRSSTHIPVAGPDLACAALLLSPGRLPRNGFVRGGLRRSLRFFAWYGLGRRSWGARPRGGRLAVDRGASSRHRSAPCAGRQTGARPDDDQRHV